MFLKEGIKFFLAEFDKLPGLGIAYNINMLCEQLWLFGALVFGLKMNV
jgi:hypothetical protein